MERPGTQYRHLIPVIILFIVFEALLFAPRLNSDGAYYYEFLRSLVMQNDLNFDDEREFYTWEWVPVFRDFLPGDWKDTGYPPNIFSFGPAVFWMPGYLAVHAGIKLINGFGGHVSTTGYGLGYRFFPMLMSVLAGLAAIFLIDRLGKHARLRPEDRGAALFLILGASHWPAFIFITPAFSHSVSVLAMAAFYLVWYRSRDGYWGTREYALFGALAGAAVIARWQNLFCLILPAVDAVTALLTAPDNRKFRERLINWISFTALFLLVLTPQLITTWILYGKPVTDPQGKGGMLWLAPRFKIVLFEGIKGLYTVNPILLIATLMLPFILFRNFRMGWGFILVFLIQTYINAVRRDWAGVGFGMRRFLNLIPVFTIGLAMLFDTLRDRLKSIPRKFLMGCGGVLIVWNLLLMAQYYYSELGAPWTTLPQQEMLRRQFKLSPHLLERLIRTGLFGNAFSGHGMLLFPAFIALAAVIAFAVFLSSTTFRRKMRGKFRKKQTLWAVILCMFLLDNWLLTSKFTAKQHNTVNLLPGPHFGKCRKLNLSPGAGYQGFPGGLVFGPGNRWTVLQLHPRYVRDEFLSPGKLIITEAFPFHLSPDCTFDLSKFPEFRFFEIISRIDGVCAPGTEVARIVFKGKTERIFPVRAGIETGSGPPDTQRKNVDCLLRSYPALHPLENGEYDYRTTVDIGETIHPDTVQVIFNGSAVKWYVHGIALLAD